MKYARLLIGGSSVCMCGVIFFAGFQHRERLDTPPATPTTTPPATPTTTSVPACDPKNCPVTPETILQRRIDVVLPGAKVVDYDSYASLVSVSFEFEGWEFQVNRNRRAQYTGSVPGGDTPTNLRKVADYVDQLEAANVLEDLP